MNKIVEQGPLVTVPAESGYNGVPPVVLASRVIPSGTTLHLSALSCTVLNIGSSQLTFSFRRNGSNPLHGYEVIPGVVFDNSARLEVDAILGPGLMEIVAMNKSGTTEIGATPAAPALCQAALYGILLPQESVQKKPWRLFKRSWTPLKKFLLAIPIMGIALNAYAFPQDVTKGMVEAFSAMPVVCVNPTTFQLESCSGSAILVHNILSATHGDTTPATPIQGDLVRFNTTWERLGIGTSGQVLTVVAGLPVWSAPGGGSTHTFLSATHTDTAIGTVVRGDVITGQSVTPAWTRLALGATGLYLKSNGTDLLYSTLAASGVGACTDQFVTSVNADTVPTCTTPTLSSAFFSNQGTTTTVLHGNAIGNPSFSSISLTTDISDILPLANGGTNTSGWTASRCVRVNAGGTALESAAGDCTVGSGLTSLNGLTSSSQTFVDDTNISMVSSVSTHTITWSGVLSVTRGGIGIGTLTGLALGNGTAAFSAYTGTSCTNQFPRSFNASGVATCGTVVSTDIANETITSGNILNGTITPGDATTAFRSGSKSVTIQTPTAAITNLIQWEFPQAVTMTEISCSTDTGTATIQFDERVRATPNTAGTNVLTSSLVCDNNSQVSSTFTNAGIAADVPFNLQVISVASTPGVVRIHAQYTLD